jgi:hypothetical protein
MTPRRYEKFIELFHIFLGYVSGDKNEDGDDENKK